MTAAASGIGSREGAQVPDGAFPPTFLSSKLNEVLLLEGDLGDPAICLRVYVFMGEETNSSYDLPRPPSEDRTVSYDRLAVKIPSVSDILVPSFNHG